MNKIILKNVDLDFPIYNANSASLRHKILNVATGGKIKHNDNKVAIIRALSNINMEIHSGQRVGIVGHNGAGKSTLLRCLSGVYAPTSGRITRIGSLSSFLEVGTGIEPELTGYDNIRRLLMLRGINKKANMQRLIQEAADFSELGDFLNLPVRTYSSGMLMRLIFSTITAEVPDIMIMDEFFSVGDEAFQKKADARLKNNIDNASILVFASHSENLLREMCNRFFRLTKGELEEIRL